MFIVYRLQWQQQRTAANPLPTDRTYTGQEQDTTGLMFYHARFYDPYLNQWIQPDTIVPDAGNVADYNRYSYVRNNPLRYKDDTGHTPWDVIDVGFWVWSAKDFLQNPTWANAGWLALDTVSLLPIIPSPGYLTRGGRIFVNLSADAVTHSDELVRLASRLQNSIPWGAA